MYGIIPPPYYGIWTVWKELSLLPKLIFLSVFILSIYSLWTAIATVVRLSGLADTSQEEDGLGKNALVALRKRCVKIHQVNGILFYLFGLVLLLSLQLAYINTPESNRPIDELITHNFIRVFVFGANVFFLFAVISGIVVCFEQNRWICIETETTKALATIPLSSAIYNLFQ